jgi:hypothetical protein
LCFKHKTLFRVSPKNPGKVVLLGRIYQKPQEACCCQATAETLATAKENSGSIGQARIAETPTNFATSAEARAMWLTCVAQQTTWWSSISRTRRKTGYATNVGPRVTLLANVARLNTWSISIRTLSRQRRHHFKLLHHILISESLLRKSTRVWNVGKN